MRKVGVPLAIIVACLCSSLPARTTPTTPQEVTIDAVSSPAERADLARWIAQSRGVLASPAFLANLKEVAQRHPTISFGSARGAGPAADLVAMMRLDGTSYRIVPSPVALMGNQYNDGALSGHNGESVDGALVTSISVGRRHLARFRSADVVERSCAINTLSHEIAHLVSSSTRFSNLVFEDEGRGLPPVGGATPIATYLIGSVAQCTYLQAEKRIDASDLAACVETFGVSAFNSNRCDQYPHTTPVTPKPS